MLASSPVEHGGDCPKIFKKVRGNPMAKAALENAIWDLEAQIEKAPLFELLGGTRKRIACGVSIGMQPTMEQQLRKVRVGQPVGLTSDLYGGAVTYRGAVVGVSGGTGSAFAVIPAQNATGNWIKVVQRLPVRIAIDPRDLAAHPLRVGMSMNAQITTGR